MISANSKQRGKGRTFAHVKNNAPILHYNKITNSPLLKIFLYTLYYSLYCSLPV